MADIFISYARADRDKIERLASALVGEGYTVWWDRHIESGAEFSTDIERELSAAKAVIVCWSEEGAKSRWVKDEATIAHRAGKLKTISLDGTEPPIGYMQFHSHGMSSWKGGRDEPQFVELRDSIATHMAKLGEAVPVATTVTSTPTPTHSMVKTWAEKIMTPVPLAAIAVLVVAIIAGVFAMGRGGESDVGSIVSEQVGSSPQAPRTAIASSDNNIVAVLPFSNRSADANDAFFADGVHDDLLTKLSKISALQVISRTSVLRFRETEQPIPEIASLLGAAVVMEGAVQRAGNRVRINVQLIDGATDQHLWAEIYDRELTAENIFDIQEEITRAIANALETVLSGDDETELSKRPTENVAAYEAYIRGTSIAGDIFTVPRSTRENAIVAFDEAIALDPNFSAAYAKKSYEQLSIYWLLGGDIYREAAAESLAKARALAPDDIETLIALGYYQYWGELDYDAADATFDKVLARAPNHSRTVAGKAFTQRRRGNFAQALEGLVQATRFDPLDTSNWVEIVDTAPLAGEWEIAENALAQAIALEPRNSSIAFFGYWFGIRLGDLQRAEREANRTVDDADARIYSARLSVAGLLRDREKVEAALAGWPESQRSLVSFPEIYELEKAQALLALGDVDEANAILATVKASVDARAVPYPAGWSPNAIVFPVRLPALMGDLEEVERLVAAYEAERPYDVWGNRNRDDAIAEAFAYAGGADQAMNYLARTCDVGGDWCYRGFRHWRAYEDMHDHPKWIAMKERYDRWLTENEASK